MKKIVIASLFVVAALAVFGVGAVFAQGGQPPVTPRGLTGTGQEGPMHVYMMKALATAIGIDATLLESRVEAGETPYRIALSQGIAQADIPALFANARIAALDLAVADGVITQQQADLMKSHGVGHGQGMGLGSCDGTGRTNMRGGWHWQQSAP